MRTKTHDTYYTRDEADSELGSLVSEETVAELDEVLKWWDGLDRTYGH